MTQQSVYESEFTNRSRYPGPEGPLEVDIAIVGGGLTGVSAALALAENGHRAALFEAGRLGAGGSGRNGGHVCQGWPGDFKTIERQLDAGRADIAWKAGVEAVELVRQRVRTYKIDCDLVFGYLNAALHKGQMRDLDEERALWERRGYRGFTRIDDKAGLAAHIDSDAYVGGLHDSGSGHIHPLKYLHGLAAAATKKGAMIFEESPVVALGRGGQKRLRLASGHEVRARTVLLCGNAYLADVGLGEMTSRLATVTSSVLATAPLPKTTVARLLPTDAAVADCNTALNYFRIDAAGRMLFGGRASYTNLDLGSVQRSLSRRMAGVFPELAEAPVERVWSGRIGITVSRTPHFGRTSDDIYYVQGFSGHGVAMSGQAGAMMANAVIGDATKFDVMARLNHMRFPGGPFRTPVLALGMTWFKLRDLLKI